MKFSSLLRRIGKKQQSNRSQGGRGGARKPSRLQVEALERRELLSGDAPRILAVLPADGSTTLSTHPTIAVTYSEDVQNANVASNYLLFNGSGQPISIQSVSYDTNSHQAILSYNNGQNLTAQKYTLFVEGDNIIDTDGDNLPLAHARQLVVAGGQSISVINVPGDGTLQTLSNYANSPPNAASSAPAPRPSAVALANINGSSVPDLIVANSGADTVTIFQGLAGGGFSTAPVATLSLQSGAVPSALLVTDLNGDGAPDIAVANSGTSTVTVFFNDGHGNFTKSINLNSGLDPIGLVAGDFNGDGAQDLAVVSGRQDFFGFYDVTILQGDPTKPGNFLGSFTFRTGLTLPTGIAAGDFHGNSTTDLPDLVISANSGAGLLRNQSTNGNFNFTQGQSLTSLPTTAVAVGGVTFGVTSYDIVLTTKNAGGQVLVFENLGNGNFSSASTFTGVANPTAITIGDVNGDNKNDLLITNGSSGGAGQLAVLVNTTSTAISFANPVTYTVDANPVAVAAHVKSGKVDEIATADQLGNDLSVLRARGDGTFFVSNDLSSQVPASAILMADLNGDHVPDIIIASTPFLTFNDTVTVYLSQPGGGYGAPATYTVGADTFNGQGGFSPLSLAVSSLTGPGQPADILVTNPGGNSISVLANNGFGVFSVLAPITVGTNPTGITVGDFNNDGIPDLAVTFNGGTATTRGVEILLGNGDRSFTAPRKNIYATDLVNPIAVVTADFNQDTNADLAVLDGQQSGQVEILLGDGTGNFKEQGTPYSANANPNSMVVADVNRDGNPDLVISNFAVPTGQPPGTPGTDLVTVLLGSTNGLFSSPVTTTVLSGTTVATQLATVTNLSGGLYPDVVLTTNGGPDNVIVLPNDGAGDGKFLPPVSYATAGGGNAVAPSIGALGSDPFIRATTFTVQTNLVSSNLVENGGFDNLDLNFEKGNLDGWQTFTQPGSQGQWLPQTGLVSPLSSVSIAPPPEGEYAAVLDQPDRTASDAFFFNGPSQQYTDYSGTHVLYQDIRIPAGATQVSLSFELYINNSSFLNPLPSGYSDPTVTPDLNYRDNVPNQQVRVDLMDPTALPTDVGSGVLRNLFITSPNTPLILGYETMTFDVTAFAGQLIRFRVAEVNNQGKLIVGLDNVQMNALFTETLPPTITAVHMRNPGFGASLSFGGNTSDPTIVGRINDAGSPSNIAYIEINPNGTTFGGPNDFRLTAAANGWDAQGNFVASIPLILPSGQPFLPGVHTVGIKAVNLAGGVSTTTITFNYQGPSLSAFTAQGPGPTRFDGMGVNYSTVSGKITATAVDPSDPSGNTIYVGSDNGGVWKTQDGGNNWTPLTDYVTDPTFGSVPVSISGLVIDPTNSNIIYASTGVADNEPTSHPGVGILKSTDAGRTWTLLGNDVFNGARISKIGIGAPDSFNPNGSTLYVAVAEGGQGPGVYRSVDGGLTWTNVLVKSNMFIDPLNGGGTVTAALASVTDLEVDVYNPENIWIGLGNIGMLPASSTAGVWFSNNHGGTWKQIFGNHDPLDDKSQPGLRVADVRNQTIPVGPSVGRVTIALPRGPAESVDENVVYVMMSTPGSGLVFADGNSMGLDQTGTTSSIGVFKTSNSGLSWTHVMLKEESPDDSNERAPRFVNLSLFGIEGADVGALAVDPVNPNVFYIGGSNRTYADIRDGQEPWLTHGLIRVDTSDMRDTNYNSPFYPNSPLPVFPNDGDDIIKAGTAAENSSTTSPPTEPGKYPSNPGGLYGGAGYSGEGVFWYDLQTGDYGQGAIFGGLGGLPFTPKFTLPGVIHSLVFDSQGRLLIGTEGGIFRGNSQGFVYDYTSGGTGIMTSAKNNDGLTFAAPIEAGMTFSDLNTNLQISDVTSVAIDPYNRNALQSSVAGIGWLGTSNSSALSWSANPSFVIPASENGFFDGFAQESPFDGTVRIAPRDPNAPPGTQATVFRTHTILVFLNDQIEKSINGGQAGSFAPAVTGLNLGNVQTSLFLPLAVNSVLQPDQNGINQAELMFWTNQIYETDSSANTWDPVSPPVPSPTTDLVTAMSFAPTTQDQLYVGTESGKVYVTLDNGNDGFPQRDNGLPSEKINGFGIDPSNSSVAYALLDGFATGTGHVFKTTDGGQTWTDVSGNLPDVPAYSMAIDPRPLPGFSGERLYLGTGVGIFVSQDGGQTWNHLGVITNPNGTTTQTLPNVPVVDLQFDPVFNKLVAATEGRGVFQISTQVVGPRVVSMTPGTPVLPGVNSIIVNFNEPVDPRSFTLSQIQTFTGPNGLVTPLAINDLDPINHQSFQITFLPQVKDGTYTITIGPNIRDFLGNAMDQNNNLINGEPGDSFTGQVAINTTDNGHFVTGIYHDLLQRTADTGGFLGFLAGAEIRRFQILNQVAQGFITSDEARGDTIYNPITKTGYYETLLGRTASPAEVSAWLNSLKQGAKPEDVIAAIAASDEFFNSQTVGGIDSNFITQLYLNADILGRSAAPSAGEVAAWVSILNSAEVSDRQQVALALDTSDEYRTDLIKADYTKFLQRSPANPEISAWLGAFHTGLSDEGFAANLLGSAEYFNNSAKGGGSNNTWVNAVFHDVLNRSPNPGEPQPFLTQLQNGVSRVTVALEILQSTEYRQDLVNGYFTKFLNRSGTQAQTAPFVTQLSQGVSDEKVIAEIVASPEYYQDHFAGATAQSAQDGNWINAAYNDMLSRPADTGGRSAFLQILDQQEAANRTGVVHAFVSSTEYLTRLITTTYLKYLGRPAGVADVNAWLPVLRQGSAGAGKPSPDEIFLAGVLGSNEYFLNQRDVNGLATDAQWVTSLYQRLLARSPDSAGFSANLNAVLNGYQPQRLIDTTAMTGSTEYLLDVVQSLYRTYLRRPPRPVELAAGLAFLQGGGTNEQLIIKLISSTEYFQNVRLGNNDNSTWLNQVYLDILGRGTANDPGAQTFLNDLNQGILTLAQVATDIVTSLEGRNRTIDQFYQTYLHRHASSSELSVWVNSIIHNGTTDEQIIAAILASNEYFLLPHVYP
jgi:photosystem II stability/assembly factor-like uncharacterized protein